MKHFGPFRLDAVNECLWHNGAQITLPPKPFAVLRYLVENPGRLITHNELLDALWPETYVQPQVLRTYVLELRKTLGDDPGQPRFIQTLPKRGYCFVAPVQDATGLNTDGLRANGRAGMEPAATRERDWERIGRESSPQTIDREIVDREEELARLRTLAELSATGQRQMVFVTGEAGIGKTALVDAFCGLAESWLAAAWGRGQCVEGFGKKEEYYPVMEALRHLCASPDGDRACRVLARLAPAWLAALGRDAASAPQPAQENHAHERMPGDLCAALEELAAEKPLILVFEDVHWADDSTLHLISALARRRAQARLIVLATYRTHSTAAEHPLKSLKQDLLLRRLGTEISLAPLGKAAVSELIRRELAQEDLPQRLAAFVHRRSEGNPLFVIAILEHLIAQRYLTREETGASPWKLHVTFEEMEAEAPERLAQMIELEMERLSEEEQRMLEAGSLMSVAFPAWAVAAALEKDPAETEDICDDLARRLYFVRHAGQDELPDGTCSAFYVFAHELYREVLYQRQAVARRARRHIRIAERMRELFAGREAAVAREMAMHYEAAGNWPSAVSALRSAAKHALERQAHAEAAELLDRTLRIAQNLSGPEREATAREIRSELAAARETLDQQLEMSAKA